MLNSFFPEWKLFKPSRKFHSFIDQMPKVQSHRGLKTEHPENTLKAFYQSKSEGFEMVEFDIRLAGCGTLVVHHDESMERVFGIKSDLSDLTYQQISSSAPIPSLKDVLNDPKVPSWKNIEIKPHSLLRQQALFKALKSLDEINQGRILFSSFDPLILYRLKSLFPDIPRALLTSFGHESWNKIYLKRQWGMGLAVPDLIHLDYRHVSRKLLLQLIDQGHRVVLWTINHQSIADYYFQIGVSGIITDEVLKWRGHHVS